MVCFTGEDRWIKELFLHKYNEDYHLHHSKLHGAAAEHRTACLPAPFPPQAARFADPKYPVLRLQPSIPVLHFYLRWAWAQNWRLASRQTDGAGSANKPAWLLCALLEYGPTGKDRLPTACLAALAAWAACCEW